MKVLHYTLGFQPYRIGGLVKYSSDLMFEQIKLGYEVFSLYPKGINIFKDGPVIKSGNEDGPITKYELVNSLPLAFFGGIKNPDDFKVSIKKNVYYDFLMGVQPDVIHLHTIMGLHEEFFLAAKDLGIPLLFTTHDYFGISPNPTFFANGISFHEETSNESWQKMSIHAKTTKILKLNQLKSYPTLKLIIKSIFKLFRKSQAREVQLTNGNYENQNDTDYSFLRNYYYHIFSFIDYFHFNSTMSEYVYRHHLPFGLNGEVLSITHSAIQNIQKIDKSVSHKTRIAYIGPAQLDKGFYEFLKLSRLLPKDKYELHTFGHEIFEKFTREFGIVQHGRFKNNELREIYKGIDVVVLPSLWAETFGFNGLEALMYGKTVFVSENVGMKDLLPEEYIFTNIEELPELLEEYIPLPEQKIKDMATHGKEIVSLYKKIVIKNESKNG